MTRTIIPFGPQHPVLPEPLHLKLIMEDEKVVEAIPALGYIHRGLEGLATRRDYNQMIYVVERVCGICSCMHAQVYCHAIEQLMEIEVPERAKYLRVIWAELHRMHSHLLWLGLFAEGMGFESLFMALWRVRERILEINEATAGNRIIISVNIMGGVRRDISTGQLTQILRDLDTIEKELKPLLDTLANDYTVKKRTVDKGILTREKAHELGAVGPTLRGSGWEQDIRMTKEYEIYQLLDFEPIVEEAGDCYARTLVRFREVFESIRLVRRAIDKLPSGDLNVKVRGRPEGEVVTRIEQSRGELFYYVKCDGSMSPERVRIRTPTFANIPPILAMLPGCELADVPVITLTVDPCISCLER